MKRKSLAYIALILIQTPGALLQVQVPTLPDFSPIKNFGYYVTSIMYLGCAILVIIMTIVKTAYGGAMKSTGAPGVTARGLTEIFEGLSSLFWFFVTIVLLPVIVYVLYLAKIIPAWVANEVVQATTKVIWDGYTAFQGWLRGAGEG